MRKILLLLCLSLLSPLAAWAHDATLDAYGCHSNKQALGSAQKRECHVGLLAGNVYASLTAELQAYIAKQQLIIDDKTQKLAQCEANITVCPVCPVCPTCEVCPVIPPPQPTTGSITLGWAANTEPDLAGYKAYCGQASHVYGAAVVVGKVTTVTISNLATGKTYHCAITAFDATGNESAVSSEVSKTLP